MNCLRWAIIVVVLASRSARAAPEEIQVYMDEMSAPGMFGLDVHNNYVATGHSIDDYAGEQQSRHRYRITPEFAYGATRWLELGIYLPLATIDQDGGGIDGLKLRVKFIAPKSAERAWFWGANFEIGFVDRALDENPYNAELKGIAGIHSGAWTVAVNANLDFKVSGPASSPPSLDLDAKASYLVARRLAVGLETYNGAGALRSLGSFGSSDEATFAVIDTGWGKWELNFGVGSGYGGNPDRLTFKAIVGIPID